MANSEIGQKTGAVGAAKSERSRPQIAENYRDYTPPRWVKKIIEQALDSVPPNYLYGLKTIVLTNRSALNRNQRRQKIWHRNKFHRATEARGVYYAATRSGPATVWLYVDNILRPFPGWLARCPFAPVVELSEVLFHEIGHHIHAVHKPVYDGKENIAEDWSRKLLRRFFHRRYWYALPVVYPVVTAINLERKIKKKIRRRFARRP